MLPPGREITNNHDFHYLCPKNLKFSPGGVPTREKCPHPMSEGLKQKQYHLSASASSQKGPLPAENIKGSSVEINVNELSLPSKIS